MAWILHGLRNGVITTDWPRKPDTYREQFPTAVQPKDFDDPVEYEALVEAAAAVCPTAAIAPHAPATLDRGKCILCGRCVGVAPEVFAWTSHGAVELSRQSLTVGVTTQSDAALVEVKEALWRRTRRLRRSVHIRHVDTGSDGSDEWEVHALTNPVYDLHRLGIFFTASPRHADILLITGIGTTGMTEPLRRTLAAMPAPTAVIAAGTDAISGGLIGGGYTRGTGVGELVPVDVWVPGSPATPFSLLQAILLVLDRLPGKEQSC